MAVRNHCLEFIMQGSVNIYTNVDGNNNNRATFRHDSVPLPLMDRNDYDQRNNGSATPLK